MDTSSPLIISVSETDASILIEAIELSLTDDLSSSYQAVVDTLFSE